jgi:hypothetical protein
VNVALPTVRARIVGAPPSTLSETFPVGVPDADATVTVTEPFAGEVTAGALMVVVVAIATAGFTTSDPLALLAAKLP